MGLRGGGPRNPVCAMLLHVHLPAGTRCVGVCGCATVGPRALCGACPAVRVQSMTADAFYQATGFDLPDYLSAYAPGVTTVMAAFPDYTAALMASVSNIDIPGWQANLLWCVHMRGVGVPYRPPHPPPSNPHGQPTPPAHTPTHHPRRVGARAPQENSVLLLHSH
jgi:hypothetical protein